MTTSPRHPRPLSFHLAVGAAVMCLIAVGLIVVRALTAPPAPSRTPTENAFAGAQDETVLGQEGGARGLQIQVMDRDDRQRVAAEFRSETIEPLQAHRYSVGEPRATFYLDDGRVVHVRSRDGVMVMPDRTRTPETGTLTNDVVVRLFEAPRPETRVDIETDTPAMTWTGRSLTFDTIVGEVSTNEPFVLTSPGYEFRARDAKVLINQALERLELLTVRQGGTLVAFANTDEPGQAETQVPAETETPSEARPGADAPHAAPAPTRATPADDGTAAPAPTPAEPTSTFYRAVMRGEVRLARAGQTIASDRLDLFARTVNNALPEGAIAPLEIEPAEPDDAPPADTPPDDTPQAESPSASGPPAENAEPSPAQPADPEPAEGQAPPEPAPDPEPDPHTRLTWTGPLEVRPLADKPTELSEDHLVARFTAEESGVVAFDDAASEASGRAAAVEYGFTTRRLLLTGPSHERSVFLSSPSVGEATMGRLELSLGTGRGVVPGPFSLVRADGAAGLDCRERTTLRFHTHDGRVTGDLREAHFVGSVRAADAEASIESGQLRVFFEPGDGGEAQLRRMVATDAVRLRDAQGNGGTCDELDVLFAPGSGEPTPTSFDARGKADFRDRTARVETEHLYATLRRRGTDSAEPNPGGSLEVVRAWATGSVRFRRFSDLIDIRGERLFADLDGQTLEVSDQDGAATVARQRTVIGGEHVRLSGTERTAMVEGPGHFEHRAGEGDRASHLRADWTMGMAFDDIAGLLEAAGDVRALHHPDPRTRERIEAALLRVELEPGSDEAAGEAPSEGEPGEREDRAVRRVYAASTLPDSTPAEGQEPPLATVESARFASALPAWNADGATEAPAMPALTRAFRLSGAEIHTDNEAGTLDVPGRGRLFVADLRTEPDEPGQETDRRGAALFDWTESLTARREAGEAVMRGEVRMSHTNATDGSRALLESARLRIRFAPGQGEAPENFFGGLRSAIATERVYLRSDARELTADLVEYDPDTGIARALALRPGEEGLTWPPLGEVRVLDRQTGSPLTARAMIWNMRTDRVDVVDPSTVVIPR